MQNVPNRNECYGHGTATFLILGDVCTRNCRFCAIEKEKKLLPPDPKEPELIVELTKKLKLKHIVITSVTRDDLPDGGASQYIEIIKLLREEQPLVTIEILTPDFQGDWTIVKEVVKARPDIF